MPDRACDAAATASLVPKLNPIEKLDMDLEKEKKEVARSKFERISTLEPIHSRNFLAHGTVNLDTCHLLEIEATPRVIVVVMRIPYHTTECPFPFLQLGTIRQSARGINSYYFSCRFVINKTSIVVI